MMDDWITHGLGRHVRVHDNQLNQCFEGFVDSINAVYGNLTVTRGPLIGTANQVKAVFSTVDVSVFPPTEGLQAMLAPEWLAVADSQDSYGVLPEVISLSETNPVDAAYIRANYLARNAYPRTTQTWATGAGQAPGLTISILGYVHWLFYIYNQMVTFGTIATDAKIVDILTGIDAVTGSEYNVNHSWLPFDTTYVQTPAAAAQVPAYEYEDRST